ncbi:MAG: sulfatase-like hydrolase/transferase [Pirellulales bacterium]|nr:sulfatase-like hydrolase/transferase [Pirellulales bacterium]
MRFAILFFAGAALTCSAATSRADVERPNVLWITAEDHGPHLGCYGDAYATTPRLDALARRGMIYDRVWSVVPVCAPARTAIITGLYPSATGAEHMRSLVTLPHGMRLFPELLRAAGYYCTNNSKEDYNVAQPNRVWDESSPRAHWRKRAAGQPFFAVFNFTQSHESQIRRRPHRAVHDPAQVRVPAYHPDLPEVRQDWAQYYDQLTEVDTAAGRVLDELAADGLDDDTIVCYFADHGPGMPRSKRSPCNSGLQVPLIVAVPDKWRQLAPADYQPGGRSSRLVSFVDLAPTVLSLAGIEPPATGHGRAFAGKFVQPGGDCLHGLRGRMDERYDCVRSATDGRFVYVRNFRPELPAGQHVEYMFATGTTRVWKQAFDEGGLTPEQAQFWQPRPAEELYDLADDPDEVHNLAGLPEHAATLVRLRAAVRQQAIDVCDVGLLPEAEMRRSAGNDAPWTMGHDPGRYDAELTFEIADLASRGGTDDLARLTELLTSDAAAMRYWAARGLGRLGPGAVRNAAAQLGKLLQDESSSVVCAAAEALAIQGTAADREPSIAALARLLTQQADETYAVMEVLNAWERIAVTATEWPRREELLATLPAHKPNWEARGRDGVDKLLRNLGLPIATKGD